MARDEGRGGAPASADTAAARPRGAHFAWAPRPASEPAAITGTTAGAGLATDAGAAAKGATASEPVSTATAPEAPRAARPDETTAFLIAAGVDPNRLGGRAAARRLSPDETSAFILAAGAVGASSPTARAPYVSADDTAQFVLSEAAAGMATAIDADLGEPAAPRGRAHDAFQPLDVLDEGAWAPLPETGGGGGAEAGATPPIAPAPADGSAATSGEPAASGDAADDGADQEAVGRSAALMSVLVIISRITGFFRTWAQAYGMSATMGVASAFTVANGLPNQLYELVMGGMLVTAFLPVYVSVKRRAGREGASAYASNLLSLVLLLMGALAVISFIFAGQIVFSQSFGASADFDAGLATYFFRFFAVSIVLYAMSSVISSVLNAERDYLWSTAAPVANNVVTTASFFAYGALVDAGQPQLGILVLAVGSPLGVLVQVLMQVPALRRHGVRLRLRVDVHDPAIRETLSIGVPTLVVTLVSFATTSVQSATSLQVNADGAAITYYARIWYMLPYSVLAIPITTAMFTELSTYVAAGRMQRFIDGIASGCGQILFLLVPFAMYLMVFARCLAYVLGGSRMDAGTVNDLAVYLVWLSISLPGYGVCTYLQKACSSLRKMHLFAVAECVAGAIQIVICLVFTPIYGFNVVGFSSTFFFVSIDAVTFLILRRELGGIGLRSIIAAGAKALVLGGLGAAAGWGVLTALETLVAPVSGSTLQAIAYTCAGGIPALIVTFGLAVAFKLPETAFLGGLAARFKR